MRHYTTPEQTKHLIDIGYPIPAGWGNQDISTGMCIALYNDGRELFNYSIAELIDLMGNDLQTINVETFQDTIQYRIQFYCLEKQINTSIFEIELVDALYRALVDMKKYENFLSKENINSIVYQCGVKYCEMCGCGIPRNTCTSLGTCELHDDFKKTIRKYLEKQRNEGI